MQSTFAPYIQYEVAIPFEIAGDCLQEVRRGAAALRMPGACRAPALARPPSHRASPSLPASHIPFLTLQLDRELYGSRSLADGFRNPALIRFTSGEESYLSPSHGGPRMW